VQLVTSCHRQTACMCFLSQYTYRGATGANHKGSMHQVFKTVGLCASQQQFTWLVGRYVGGLFLCGLSRSGLLSTRSVSNVRLVSKRTSLNVMCKREC
jgi:hypothetical protein